MSYKIDRMRCSLDTSDFLFIGSYQTLIMISKTSLDMVSELQLSRDVFSIIQATNDTLIVAQ